jgi:hypothetical protein
MLTPPPAPAQPASASAARAISSAGRSSRALNLTVAGSPAVRLCAARGAVLARSGSSWFQCGSNLRRRLRLIRAGARGYQLTRTWRDVTRSAKTAMFCTRRVAAGVAVALSALCVALGACGSGGGQSAGSTSPQEAVSVLLAPLAHRAAPGPATDESRKRALALWRFLCDHVDPRLRAHLTTDLVSRSDPRANCGAAVAVAIRYTGDNGKVGSVSALTGKPVSADTHGDESIVTVGMHYVAAPNATAPPPPTRATVRALAVKHAGGWWVASPEAFNPAVASAGGLTASQLRADYAKLLAGANP